MDRCSTDAVSCWIQQGLQPVFQAWGSLHGPLAWVVNGVLLVVAGVCLVWEVRWFRRYVQEKVQQEEQWRREEKLREHQTVSLIRESEEWCLDTHALKSSWERYKEQRRLRDRGRTFLAVSLLPMALLMLVGIVSFLFPTLREGAILHQGMAILGTLAIAWCVGCLFLSFHCLAQIKRLVRPLKW